MKEGGFMKKLRYKFYVVLLIILVLISASFIFVLNFITNRNTNDVKDAYYDMICQDYQRNIRMYSESIYMILNNNKFYADFSEDNAQYFDDFKFDLLKNKSPNIDIYFQKIMSDDEDDISVYMIYSSKSPRL